MIHPTTKHLCQPNKTVQIPYKYTIRESEYMNVYTFEMEPVIRRLSNGKLLKSWRSIPIDRLTDEEVTDYLLFERWAHRSKHMVKNMSEWEALHIFREDIYSIAYNHIYSKNNVKYWEGVLEAVRKQDDLKMRQKIERAREVPMEEVVRMFGYEPRMGFICCPFHGEKTPSLKIYSNSWYCFGCNKGSSTIDFVMEHNNIDFKNAVEFLN